MQQNTHIELLLEFYNSKISGKLLRPNFWVELMNALRVELNLRHEKSDTFRKRITEFYKNGVYNSSDEFIDSVMYYEANRRVPAYVNDEDVEDSDNAFAGVIKQHDKKYYFNEATNTWVFWLKASPKPLVIHGDDLKSIKARYSNWDGEPNSLNQLARDFSIPRNWLIELFRVMGITHDSEPFLEQEILEKDSNLLVEEILQNKKRIIYQKLEASQWDEIKRKAKMFDEFEVTILKPMTDKMMEIFPSYVSKRPIINTKSVAYEPSCMVFAPTDVHYGKMPYFNQGYDPNVFEEEVFNLSKRMIERSLASNNVQKIVAVSGSDFFHIDNISHSTSALTSQAGQLFGNYHDVMVRGYALAIRIWDMLVDTGIPIHTVNIPGNHDKVYSLGLGLALEQRYRGVKNFTIDNTIYPRKFASYGKNLFCFEHGENIARAGAKRTTDMMSTILLETKSQNLNPFEYDNYFYFTGHYHKKMASHDEDRGIVDIVLPSLSVTDMWHKDNRYEGNRKSIGTYVFDEANIQNIMYETSTKLNKF